MTHPFVMHILFITSSRIGDAVLSTVILNALEKKHENLNVTVVCGELTVDLFKSIPFCTKVIALKKRKHSMHWVDLYTALKSISFDEIYDLRGSLIGFFLKTKKLFRWKKKYYNQKIHQVEALKYMAKIDDRSVLPKLWIKQDEVVTNGRTPCLAVAPAANWIGKEWPAVFFAETLNAFLKEFPKAEVAFFAAPNESHVIETIIDHIESKYQNRINVYNNLTLYEVCCRIDRCQVFLGNDSGLMHIASALNVPVMALFGPSNEKRYGPYGHIHKIIRTPESFEEIQKLKDFTFSSKATSFMKTLTSDCVTQELMQFWTRNCESV